jgi:hypothetical protein
MAEYHDREHYIPLRRSELVDVLARDQNLPTEQGEAFRKFCQILTALFHFQYHDKLEELKDEYTPFDPDRVTHPLKELSLDARELKQQQLFDKFTWLMERANYKRLSREELLKATESASAWGINLDIDFNLFENLEVFIRGDTMTKRTKRNLLTFWKVDTIKVPVYQRVVIMLKLRQHKRLDQGANVNAVYLKLFKEIPKADVEMLLPGGRLKMPKLAIGKLGASLASAVGFVGYKIYLELGALLQTIVSNPLANPLTFWAPISLIGGYGYKQWAGYQSARQTYTMQLTQSLYYLNLDSNGGVLFHLLDEAEEQECRETILGYYYLWRYAGERGWKASDLDDYVEMDLERLAGLKVDFEIQDALDKLVTLGLVEQVDDRYRAIPINKALEKLDYRWDNFFQYNMPDNVL